MRRKDSIWRAKKRKRSLEVPEAINSRGMRILDWVREKVVSPCKRTEQTRKLVPPRSTARYRPYYKEMSFQSATWNLPAYLFCAIGHSSHEGRDLAQCSALLAQALIGLLDVLGNPALHLFRGVCKLARNARGLVQ